MSVEYSIQPVTTPGQTGKYFMRVEPKGAVRKAQLIQSVASKTLINPVDAEAVFDAAFEEIIVNLIAGNFVILDDQLGFTMSINAEHPMTDPTYSIQLPGDKLQVNVQLKNPVRDRVRAGLATASDFVKIATRVRQPQITRVFDTLTKQVGKYSPGAPLEINGSGLDLPADLASDTRNGVFFKVGTTETRATNYMSESDVKIVCFVPSTVTGSGVEIIVRTDYETTALREGSITGIAQA